MITSLTQAIQRLPMVNQEGGAMPGKGLTALETFTYFVAAPTLLFVVISAISWFASAPKKAKDEKKDVVNRIDDEDDSTFLTMIA